MNQGRMCKKDESQMCARSKHMGFRENHEYVLTPNEAQT